MGASLRVVHDDGFSFGSIGGVLGSGREFVEVATNCVVLIREVGVLIGLLFTLDMSFISGLRSVSL